MKKILAFSLATLVCLLSSCASRQAKVSIPVSDAPHIIYLVYRHWHTSIVLDAKQLALHSPLLAEQVRGEDYARIGWGDGDYFTGKSKSWSSAGKALVASRYSALQLLTYSAAGLREIPPQTIVPLAIGDQGLQQLIKMIESSIALDKQMLPLPLHATAAEGEEVGIFFQANGRYSLFNNCNSWSAEALQRAGLPLASRLTAQGVFRQAGEISQVQAQAGLFKASGQF